MTEPADLPTLHPAALHGIAGDFVRLVGPETEAHPAALLVQFLAYAGVMVGRGPFVRVGADRHGANESAVVVGLSSRARKGSAEGWVRAALEQADPGFVVERVQSGLSSGEGLIYAVRDPLTKAGKEGPVVVDEGVGDKRLLAVEPEFARVLRVAARDGNTLSAQLRQAWDSPAVMQTLTRAAPLKATAAHVGVLGHITPAELRAELTRTDAANGFANRFLWLLAARVRLLPRGGSLHPHDLAPLGRRHRPGFAAGGRSQ